SGSERINRTSPEPSTLLVKVLGFFLYHLLEHSAAERRLRFVLILPLSSLQRRDGRRNDTATSACPSTVSSHCARRNLESCFGSCFIYLRLALYGDPRCHLRSRRSVE